MKTTVPATCKPSTQDDYQAILDLHVLPVFKSKVINEINRGHVKTFLLTKISEGFAGSTVTHMKNVISGIMNKALDDEVVTVNPVLGLGKIIPSTDTMNEINPLTAQELSQLLATFEEHFSKHYTIALLLSRTGMRIGEAIALKWGDIDFNGRFIEIRRSFARGRVSTPKSGKIRRVDMSPQLKMTLKKHRADSKRKGMKIGLGDAPEYVFTNTIGGPIDLNNWRRRVFKKAVEKAELRQIRIHDLRHTYATLRISKSDNIADVSKQLGHHSVKLTMDVYYHWIPGGKKSEVDALDDLHLSAPHPHPTPEQSKKGAANVG
jgi:integrase